MASFHMHHRPLIVTTGLVSIFLLLAVVFCFWPADSDPQGGDGLWCDNSNINTIKNSSGWTVSGHNTVCSGFGGNSAIYIYAYPEGKKEGRESLIFRYFEHGGAALPQMECR
jgi:hypothetical protein